MTLPRRHTSATSGRAKSYLIVLGMAEWSGLGIHRRRARADVGMREDVEAFRVCGHESVFDAVVNHFHEVPRACGTTMQVSFLCCAVPDVASWGATLLLQSPERVS